MDEDQIITGEEEMIWVIPFPCEKNRKELIEKFDKSIRLKCQYYPRFQGDKENKKRKIKLR